MLELILSLAIMGADTTAVSVAVKSAEPAGDQWFATSQSFVVRNCHPAHDARQVAAHCERWRTNLQKYWSTEQSPDWQCPCEVTIHAGMTGYLATVGAGGRSTFGSSRLVFRADKQIKERSIDIRGDSPRGLAALPHEMTHVVLADWLDGRQPPRWADEGMAILADSHEKQMLHERDLSRGLSQGCAFRVAELVTIDSYPEPHRIPAFYGQSASLTACLALRDDPARFVEFLRRSLDGGYDQALRDIYHIDNIAQLEQHWHSQRLAWRSGYHGVQLVLSTVPAADQALSN
jgi:hypothetical protein